MELEKNQEYIWFDDGKIRYSRAYNFKITKIYKWSIFRLLHPFIAKAIVKERKKMKSLYPSTPSIVIKGFVVEDEHKDTQYLTNCRDNNFFTSYVKPNRGMMGLGWGLLDVQEKYKEEGLRF